MRLEFHKCLLTITKKACEEINLRPQILQLTVRKYLEDSDKRDEIEAMEKRVRMSVEGKKITQTKDQVLEAAKFEYGLQRELTKKLDALALILPQEKLNEVESVETSKISDALLAAHGFDLNHLDKTQEHFKLDTNPSFIKFRKEVQAKKELEDAKFLLKDEVQQKINEMTASLGEPQFNDEDEDGALTFEFFLNVNKVIVTCALEQLKEFNA